MFGAPLRIEAMPLREMVVHQVLVGFLHLYLRHGAWRQKHVLRMPQMPGLYPTFLRLSGIAVPNLMTISDSVVQLSNWFSSLRRK